MVLLGGSKELKVFHLKSIHHCEQIDIHRSHEKVLKCELVRVQRDLGTGTVDRIESRFDYRFPGCRQPPRESAYHAMNEQMALNI